MKCPQMKINAEDRMSGWYCQQLKRAETFRALSHLMSFLSFETSPAVVWTCKTWKAIQTGLKTTDLSVKQRLLWDRDKRSLSVFTEIPVRSKNMFLGLREDNEWCYLLKGGHRGAARSWKHERCVCVCEARLAQGHADTCTESVLLDITPPRHTHTHTHSYGASVPCWLKPLVRHSGDELQQFINRQQLIQHLYASRCACLCSRLWMNLKLWVLHMWVLLYRPAVNVC